VPRLLIRKTHFYFALPVPWKSRRFDVHDALPLVTKIIPEDNLSTIIFTMTAWRE
jgi:hypothetical protein